MEYLGLAKAIRCEDSARLFPYQWWVQTFFNRCPDREGWSEVITLNSQVGTITNTNLINCIKEMVAGITRKDIGQTGLNSHANKRK